MYLYLFPLDEIYEMPGKIVGEGVREMMFGWG